MRIIIIVDDMMAGDVPLQLSQERVLQKMFIRRTIHNAVSIKG